MPALRLNTVVVPVAPGSVTRELDDGVARKRSVNGRLLSTRRASVKWKRPVRTAPMTAAAADALEAELLKPTVSADGELIGAAAVTCAVDLRSISVVRAAGATRRVYEFTLIEV